MAKIGSLRRYVTSFLSFTNSRSKNKYRNRSSLYFSGRVTPELVKLMLDVWMPIIGPGKDILVIRVVRPKNLHQLGISLIGSTFEKGPVISTSDQRQQQKGEGENETAETEVVSQHAPSRHFVHKILPHGLFTSLGCLEPGDELLQANGYKLHGHSHIDVVRCLRSLPAHIELVIARSPPDGVGSNDDASTILSDGANDSTSMLQVAASEIGSVATGADDSEGSRIGLSVTPFSSDAKVNEWIRSSLADESALPSTSSTAALSIDSSTSGVFPSSGDTNAPFKPTWSAVPLIVMLLRNKRGFGFSICVYDENSVDGRNTGKLYNTIKRTRSLSRHGTAPGDMNHLGEGRFATISRSMSSCVSNTSLLVIKSIVPGSYVELDGRISVGDRLLFVNDRKLTRATLGEAANVLHNAPLGYTMIGVAKMKLIPNQPMPNIVSSPQLTAFVSKPDEPNTLQEEFAKEHVKDHPLDYYTSLMLDFEDSIYHAASLVVPEMNPMDEKIVRVRTNNLPLGCELDALAAGGVDGCRVVKVLRGGAVEGEAALVPNDYITRINSDNLRRITNAEAFRVLRKASLECDVIEVGYYPWEKVISHRLTCVEGNSLSAEDENSRHPHANGSLVHSSLIEDLPPPDLIITTESFEQLLPKDSSQQFGWSQMRELKLRKLPGEDSWGLCITGPDEWKSNESPPAVRSLLPEVSQPVFVSNITPDTAADRCRLLKPGDIIIGVNGMDATRVGCRTVAEWIQGANLVSSFSPVSSKDNGPVKTDEWTFLYLLVLPLHISGASSLPPIFLNKPCFNLQSIPPVVLTSDSTAPSEDKYSGSRSSSFNTNTLARPAFMPCNDSFMEEPISVASLEQGDELPEPESVATFTGSDSMPPLPQQLSALSSNGWQDMYIDCPPPPLPFFSSRAITSPKIIQSQSTWCDIASLAQLTQAYHRPDLSDDEIHVVSITLTTSTSKSKDASDIADELNDESAADCETGLGIRLVGHRDNNSCGVFIWRLREGSLADRTPGLQATDEIVQVNNVCLIGLTDVSAKLFIAKETEAVRHSRVDGDSEPRIFLVIRHNIVYNASMMAKPAGVCGHFLHHPALRSASPESPCMSKTPSANSKRKGHDFIDVTIEKNPQDGFGLLLVNANPRGDLGVFVQSVLATGPAGLSGKFRAWDRIVAINGEEVKDYDAALDKLATCYSCARLRLARTRLLAGQEAAEGDEGVQVNSETIDLPRSFSPHSLHTPILRGVETTVEIIHSANDLGFSIIDGSNTHLGGIFIEKIHINRTIHRDGRLRSGDRILAVDNVDLRRATHAQATKALREAKTRLLLTVLRGGDAIPFSFNEIMQMYDVDLQKHPGGTFGLVLDDYHTGGAVISDVRAGSPASRATVLHPGDVILEVDGLDVHKASALDVMALLKKCSNSILLRIGRPKPPSSQPIPQLKLFSVLLTSPATTSMRMEPEVSASPSALSALKGQSTVMPSSNIFGVILRPSLANEVLYAPGRLIVESIIPESAASRGCMIQVGDRLLGVDREPVGWLSIDDLQRFSCPFDSLTFEFGRLPPLTRPSSSTLHASAGAASLPSPQPLLHNSRLAPLTEDEETAMAILKKPISVVVEDNTVREAPKTPSPVKHPLVGFAAIEDADSDYDNDEACSNVTIRQIQLPPPNNLSDLNLGITLASARGACGGQRVKNLDPSSPAAMAGLEVGDRIIGLDNRLVLALGRDDQDSTSVIRAIESAWRLRYPPSDLAPLTFTVVRPTPLPFPSAFPKSISPMGHFPVFRNVFDTGAFNAGLLATRQHFYNPSNSRLHRDFRHTQLDAGPPGLLIPGMATGLASGVYRSGVDYYPGLSYYNNGPLIGNPAIMIPGGMCGDAAAARANDYVDNDGEEVVDNYDCDDDDFCKDANVDADPVEPLNPGQFSLFNRPDTTDDVNNDLHIYVDPPGDREDLYENPLNAFGDVDPSGYDEADGFGEGPSDVINQPDSAEFGIS